MIAVLADDLSGAAEMAGAAFDRGRSAEVQLAFDAHSDANVVVVDTDSRWRRPEDAARLANRAVRHIAVAEPEWMFKKIDSVLRGPVLAEVRAAFEASGLRRAVLVPANPSRRRVIAGGRYFVDGQPLADSILARDPEYPRSTSDVRSLLGDAAGEVVLLGRDQPLPAAGIALPDIADAADLDRRAAEVDAQTLPVGGVEFFHALLTRWQAIAMPETAASTAAPVADASSTADPAANSHTLFICGSAAAWTQRHHEATRNGIPLVTPPAELFDATKNVPSERWQSDLAAHLKRSPRVLVAIGEAPACANIAPRDLVERFSAIVVQYLAENSVERLCIEGGATAAAVVRRLGAERLSVTRTYGPGIVALAIVGRARLGQASCEIIVKPGSYAWPATLWSSESPRAPRDH